METSIKKFRARTLKEAVEKAYGELGESAVIIKTTNIKKGWLWGPREVEVMVSVPFAVDSKESEDSVSSNDSNHRPFASHSRSSTQPEEPKKEVQGDELLSREIRKLRDELSHLAAKEVAGEVKVPVHCQNLFRFWSEKGMSTREITELFKQIEQRGAFLEEVVQGDSSSFFNALKMSLPEAELKTDRRKIVILVGPTGVGKSTTVAKMAFMEKFQKNKKVCLITLDDFKVGGADQLAHFSRVLDIPFIKARPSESIEDRCRIYDADTILIDTSGLAPNDESRASALQTRSVREIHGRVQRSGAGFPSRGSSCSAGCYFIIRCPKNTKGLF